MIIWAVGTNGEGSSHVVSALLDCFFASDEPVVHRVFITRNSLLDKKLPTSVFSKYSANIVAFPAILSIPIVHLVIKMLCFLIWKPTKLIVLDDFPFYRIPNQTLLLHQPNLVYLYDRRLLWKVRRYFFSILLSPRTHVVVQAEHMRLKLLESYSHTHTTVIRHSFV